MWVIIFWLKPGCVIEKIKSLKAKLIKYKAYRKCIWIKKIKAGENYLLLTTFFKKRFPVNIAKFLGTATFIEHFWWLLLFFHQF